MHIELDTYLRQEMLLDKKLKKVAVVQQTRVLRRQSHLDAPYNIFKIGISERGESSAGIIWGGFHPDHPPNAIDFPHPRIYAKF